MIKAKFAFFFLVASLLLSKSYSKNPWVRGPGEPPNLVHLSHRGLDSIQPRKPVLRRYHTHRNSQSKEKSGAWAEHFVYDGSNQESRNLKEIILQEAGRPFLVGGCMRTPYMMGSSPYPYYTSCAANQFNAIVAEYEHQWDVTEPSRGQFSWGPGDMITDWTANNGMTMRYHAMLWHDALPGWVKQIQKGEDLMSALQDHIKGVCQHNRDKMKIFIVINEPISEDGSRERDYIFTSFHGYDYYSVAFSAARQHCGPDAKLYMNEYGIEYGRGTKFQTFLQLVKTLLHRNVPIDGIGFQGHYSDGKGPSIQELGEAMKKFTDLGLEVMVTELDDGLSQPDDQNIVKNQIQSFVDTIGACLKNPKCKGVWHWAVDDNLSWRTTFDNRQSPTLLDKQCKPKFTSSELESVL
ncbi:glycoside hydrolase [Violaceomyces palustris]|uniref:Glycoside hydrolase n=1 Tax=Violaceomyces palustris TaxID=1673888 RepID=A0ACD0NPH9_9BASI|nr:glycoside hydrolase [Violaceomyces palustris]